MVNGMINIRMLMRIKGKNRENIEQFLLHANHKSSMFIGHFRDKVFPKLKLIYFAFLYGFMSERFGSVVCPPII